MKLMPSRALWLLVVLFFPMSQLAAQSDSKKPNQEMQELEKQFQEMQTLFRQLMETAPNMDGLGGSEQFKSIDTSFLRFFDLGSGNSFGSDEFGGVFRFSPFGFFGEGEEGSANPFSDMMRMLEQMSGESLAFPKDDGNLAQPENEDDLVLPEDKLRAQENGETPPAGNKVAPKKRNTVKL